MTRHYAWLDIVISVAHGCWGSPVLAQLERKHVADRSEKCFHGGCTNLPIVADVNLSYAAKSPNSTWGVIFSLNYIVDRRYDVYGSASLLALRV